MGIWKTNKSIERMNKMIDNATEGKPIENGFDETKLSALETKFSHYLAMNSATKSQLAEEKARINELISDISHQTKTPIANILLYSQILEESDLPDQEKQCVNALITQAEKLHFLISSLVKASRLETGIISVVPKTGSIQTLLEEVVEQSKLKAMQKDVVVLCKETQINAMFDLKWTVEALYNVVDNAIKYSNEGGQVTIEVSEYEFFVKIDVIDNGKGIREEDTSRIFARFFRASEVSHEEGVGIGLYLAREILTAQNGYIKVNSKVGKGSVFSIFLPSSFEIFQNC